MSGGRGDRPIGDYGLIGDMRGAALVASDGSIDWLCLGRFDADPVLLALLDADRGGRCALAFDPAPDRVVRRYLEATNILETTFSAATGTVVVTDFMPVARVHDVDNVGPDSASADRVVRLVRCTAGRSTIAIRVDPGFDWARRHTAATIEGDTATYAGEDFFVASSHPLTGDGRAVTSTATLEAGENLTLVLGKGAHDGAAIALASRQQADTHAYWRTWSARCTYRGVHAAMVLRSALCLKLLTFAPSGGVVAAPTTGLPEVVGGVRNWDYRYVWTRDASFNVSAFLNLGFRREAAEFLRFLHEACDHGEVVRVMYAVDGALPLVRKLTHLAGWKGSSPVMVGNEASGQDQFEIYGELLAALSLYVDEHGVEGLCSQLVDDLPAFVDRLAGAAIASWRLPDQGIWELKGEPRHIVHTKAMCWVALDRAIDLAPRIGSTVPTQWRVERDRMRADCLEHGWNARRRTFTMEYGGDAVDMALLRLPLLGFIAADDPRITGTLAAMEAELGRDDLYRRYRFDDDLPGEEGAFVACSFWMAAVKMMRGETDAARALIERLLARANDLGLYAEEIDVATGQQLGNFPQGFSHMAVIHELLRLDEAGDPGTRVDATHPAVQVA